MRNGEIFTIAAVAQIVMASNNDHRNYCLNMTYRDVFYAKLKDSYFVKQMQ